MLHGKRIEHCPFIPFVIPHAKSINYRKISKILQFEDQKPHLIFLANSTFEDPPYVECINIHVLYFHDFKGPKSTYYDFLELSFEIIANCPSNKIPFIGVASRSTPDFCEFFIARWLINECGYSINEALDLVRQSLPPGITKKKFLHQLSKLNLKFEKPIQEDNISNSSEQTSTTNEITQVPIKTENETMNAEVNQQNAIPVNTSEIKQDQIPEQIIQTNEPPKNNEVQVTGPSPSAEPSQEIDQQQIQAQMQMEGARIKEQRIQQQKQQQQQVSEPPENYQQQQHHHQLQLQMQQRQQLALLQKNAQDLVQFQNQVKQRLQEFQSNPYDYQQQNINYQYQLQNSLKEASARLQAVELQIQQIQANQQAQQQQQQQQQQQIPPKQITPSNSGPIHRTDSFSSDTEKIKHIEDTDYKSSASINTSGSSVIMQNQPQQIEQPVPPQHVNMYFTEIVKKMNVPFKKCLFTKFAPITFSQLEIIKNDLIMNFREATNTGNEPPTYCLMPEPNGIRALLYLRHKIPLIIFQNYSPIQLKLDINTSEEDTYIFEVIFVRECQTNIVLCDVMFAKDEDVSSRPFNYRIGIIKSCYDVIFKPLNSELIKFTIRQFYRLKDYRLLTDLFENHPRKKFTKYPLLGISATLTNSRNCHSSKCMFLWTKDVIENPRVIIEIDFGSRIVFGFAQNGTTSAIIAYLGKLTPEMFDLNGKVVEIEVLDQDPEWTNILNAKIIKLSDDYPWTTHKFKKYYPEREPHMDIQGLNSMLGALASIP